MSPCILVGQWAETFMETGLSLELGMNVITQEFKPFSNVVIGEWDLLR
jgi:hypothetical protein